MNCNPDNTFIVFFLLFLQINIFAQGNNIRFENLTSEDGLSQNSVIKIFQDSKGFLWFGTFDGLNRYDGYKFQVYKSDATDTNSISGNYFDSICEDKYGNLWIGSLGGGLNKYIRDKDIFIKYKHNPQDKTSLSSNKVHALFIDTKGNLWVGTENGLDLYDYKDNNFIHFRKSPENPNSLSNNYIISIGEDAHNNLWIGTWYGLDKFDLIHKKFKIYYSDTVNPRGLFVAWTNKIFLDREKNLWLGTSEGLCRYDEKQDNFIRYSFSMRDPNSLSDNDVKDILEDKKGNLWIATFNGGLNKFNKTSGTFTRYLHNPFDQYSLSSNKITSLYQDKSGLLWIGTDGSGIDKLDFRTAQFHYYQNIPGNKNSLNNDNIYSIFEDRAGNIWLGTFGGGLSRFNPNNKNKIFTEYVHNPHNPNSLINNNIRCLCGDNAGNLWIGTETGLDKFNPAKKKFTHYNMNDNPGLLTNSIFSLFADSAGNIWVGTYDGGLSILNVRKNSFINFSHKNSDPKSICCNVIREIFEDASGRIWLCTDTGLDRFDGLHHAFIHYRNSPKDTNSLSTNSVLNIYQDKSGVIWVGTTMGLNKIEGNIPDPEKTVFKHYNVRNGLPDNSIQGILEDNGGNLWISTNRGLSKFNPLKGTFKNYTAVDGLPSNEFYTNASARISESGKLMFGGNKGFCFFRPDSIKDDLFIPPVEFTDLSLFNRHVFVGGKINGERILKKTITETREIILSNKNNIFSLEFSALDYASPQNNIYAYKMEGLESNWNYLGRRNYVSFTNLPAGNYILKVKGANCSGVWNPQGVSLRIVVLPPYWETWWFRGLVLFFVILMVFAAYKIKVKNIEKRKKELEIFIKEKSVLNKQLEKEINEHKRTEIELRKAKEEAEKSDRLKSEFLAQISHEIRTPINAILSFSSLIKEDVSRYLSDEMQEGFSIIESAGRRLIRTVDLILNMSLLQTDSFELNLQSFDLFEKVLRNKINEYTPAAKEKGLRFEVKKDVLDCTVFADESTVDQILDNLINNAVKFTRRGIVGIRLFKDRNENLAVEIYDTGIGISKEYLSQLFKPFSQEETGYKRKFEGNGLGLALTKKFADLNNASIEVASQKGYGTKFSLTFYRKSFTPVNK